MRESPVLYIATNKRDTKSMCVDNPGLDAGMLPEVSYLYYVVQSQSTNQPTKEAVSAKF